MLVTARIPDLRDQNNSVILGSFSKLDNLKAVGAPRSAVTTEKRRLAKAVAARIELESLARTSAQRQAYGEERFNAGFVRLIEIAPPPGSNLKATDIRTALWKALPNSKFKRFQEAFCDPHNYVVPKYEISREGRVSYPRSTALKELSVQPCLVSPDRITDELAISLGLLTEATLAVRSPIRRLREKATLEVIGKLKAIWDEARPLSERDFRILVIDSADQNRGTILYTREDVSGRVERCAPPGGPARVNPATTQHFTNSFGAYRKTLHAKNSYDTESETLSNLLVSVRSLLRRLGVDWRRETPPETKARIATEVIDTIEQSIQALSRCHEFNKVRAEKLLTTVRDLRDSRGRVNPAVVASRVAHALHALERRIGEAVDKIGYNERDRVLLRGSNLKEAQTLSLNRVALLRESGRVLRQSVLFSARKLSPDQLAREVDRCVSKVLPTVAELKSVRTRPLLSFANAILEGETELRRALTDRSPIDTRKALVKLYICTKLCATQVVLERIKENLASREAIPVGSISRLVRELNEVLEARIFPKLRVERHEEAFSLLTQGVAELSKLLEQYRGVLKDCGSKSAPVRELKKLATSINPERLALELL